MWSRVDLHVWRLLCRSFTAFIPWRDWILRHRSLTLLRRLSDDYWWRLPMGIKHCVKVTWRTAWLCDKDKTIPMQPLANFSRLPWGAPLWLLVASIRFFLLIWFVFVAVNAKSKLYQVPLSSSRDITPPPPPLRQPLQNKATQTKTTKSSLGKRRKQCFHLPDLGWIFTKRRKSYSCCSCCHFWSHSRKKHNLFCLPLTIAMFKVKCRQLWNVSKSKACRTLTHL